MSTADIMLQQAQALIKSGRRADARPLLEQIVNADDQNEQAWLWLSACVESLEEQRICLENVLMLNPSNQKAIKGLETIRQKLGNSTTSSKPQMPQMPLNTRPVTPPPPAQDPYNPYNPASNDAFGSPYDSNQFEQPQADEGWSPATSVDWGRGGGPAYGSGKKIKEPTASEFDSWVAKLPLDGKKREEPPPPQVMPRRGTADIPPMPVTSTDEQFNIPSSYNAGDDPFRGNFDFDDFQSSAPSPSSAGGKSVNPFGLAADAPPPAAAPQQNFDFNGFDGPFSSGSSSTNDAYSYDQPPQTQAGARQMTTNDDWGDFGTPSFTQHDSAADFNVPGGFNDATAEDAYARRSTNSTSAERFSFGDRRAPSGTQGRRSQLPNIESAEGLFSDDAEVHSDIPAPAGVEFSDDDALTSSGIFGAAKRTSEGASGKAKTSPAPYAPSMGPFKAIPPEIQVKAGGGSGKALLAIVGLLILNVASILVLLFVNLRGMGLF